MKTLQIRKLFFAVLILINGCNYPQQNTKNGIKSKDSSIAVGIIPALSGFSAQYGPFFQNGILMAVREQNERGGLLGHLIDTIIVDSKSSKEEVTKFIPDIIDKRPVVIFAHLSNVCLAIKTFTERDSLLFIASSGADNLMENTKFVIRNYTAPEITGKKTAEEIKNRLGINNIGVFYSNDDWGRSTFSNVSTSCKDIGINILFSSLFNLKETDYKVQIRKVLKTNPQYIHVLGIGESTGILIKQIRQLGYKGLIGGDLTINSPDTRKTAGDAIHGVYYLDYNFVADSLEIKKMKFMEKYVEFMGGSTHDNPLSFFVLGYEGARIYFEAVKNANTFDPAKVVKAINEINNYQGVFCPIEISQNEIKYELKFNKVK